MKGLGGIAKTQKDLVESTAPSKNQVVTEELSDLPGLKRLFDLTDEERKSMFVTALRSRRGITRFSFRLGDYNKTKTELTQMSGLTKLHNRSYEEIASVLLGATQLKDDFIGLTYEVDEDRNGRTTAKLEIEYGVNISKTKCMPDAEGKVKDTNFRPHFTIEYIT